MEAHTPAPLLEVHDLRTYYYRPAENTFVRAVDGISFEISRAGSLGLAGESGSGKSQTALSIMGLIDGMPGLVSGAMSIDGDAVFEDLPRHCTFDAEASHTRIVKDIGGWNRALEARMKSIRGRKISMIFQEPKSSLVPYMTVEKQLRKTIAAYYPKHTHAEHWEKTEERMRKLAPDDYQRILKSYPDTLSGGECQRVMIALALLGNPDLLIADEPTTQLDVINAYKTLSELQSLNVALLFITHDLAILGMMVEHIAVMFAGKIVEYGSKAQLLDSEVDSPHHPYTRLLLKNVAGQNTPEDSLDDTPRPFARPHYPGCRFYERCSLKNQNPALQEKCFAKHPDLVEIETGHTIACWAMTDGE